MKTNKAVYCLKKGPDKLNSQFGKRLLSPYQATETLIFFSGNIQGKAVSWPYTTWDSQVAPEVKNLPVNARDIRDMGTIPESGRSPEGGHGNPL